MEILLFLTLVTVGFTTCVEFGSYAFMHPVIKRLPPKQHIQVEQGLLRTFGRVMPVLLPFSSILTVALALTSDAKQWLPFAAASALGMVVITTVSVNVPINNATGKWDAENPPKNWQALREKWESFQAIRAWLLLAAFVLLCAYAAF